jgi:hypothetical protein
MPKIETEKVAPGNPWLQKAARPSADELRRNSAGVDLLLEDVLGPITEEERPSDHKTFEFLENSFVHGVAPCEADVPTANKKTQIQTPEQTTSELAQLRKKLNLDKPAIRPTTGELIAKAAEAARESDPGNAPTRLLECVVRGDRAGYSAVVQEILAADAA